MQGESHPALSMLNRLCTAVDQLVMDVSISLRLLDLLFVYFLFCLFVCFFPAKEGDINTKLATANLSHTNIGLTSMKL